MRPQPGFGFSGKVAAAAPAPSGPVILNGTFADSSNWTIASGGGAASMSITPGSPGTLNSVSGSGFGTAACTQTLSGLVSGQTYTINYTVTAVSNGAVGFALGGGSVINGAAVIGPGSASVVAGSANQDLVMHPTSPLGGRTASLTGLSIA